VTYEGYWKADKKHGKGLEIHQNENVRYEGDFYDGFKEGKGKMVFENGDYYHGQF